MMGRYFFSGGVFPVVGDNGEPREITVKSRTLLVNTELCPTPETENSTVLARLPRRPLLHAPSFERKPLSSARGGRFPGTA